jgi:DNA modification methylase
MLMFFKIPVLFRRKPAVKPVEKLDPMSEDSLKVEAAVLTMVHMSKKYGVAGMKEMAVYLGNKIGNEIVNSGLRRWEI